MIDFREDARAFLVETLGMARDSHIDSLAKKLEETFTRGAAAYAGVVGMAQPLFVRESIRAAQAAGLLDDGSIRFEVKPGEVWVIESKMPE